MDSTENEKVIVSYFHMKEPPYNSTYETIEIINPSQINFFIEICSSKSGTSIYNQFCLLENNENMNNYIGHIKKIDIHNLNDLKYEFTFKLEILEEEKNKALKFCEKVTLSKNKFINIEKISLNSKQTIIDKSNEDKNLHVELINKTIDNYIENNSENFSKLSQSQRIKILSNFIGSLCSNILGIKEQIDDNFNGNLFIN